MVSVRSIFCCYNPDEQEGDLALLNMMERFRVELLKVRKVGGTGTDGKSAVPVYARPVSRS